MSVRSGFFIILAFTIWRVIALRFDVTDLFVDEAQYWFWSENLDFGYYSKPPMIAWVLRAVTELSGSDAIFWIRVSGPVIHMATAIVLMAAARRLTGEAIAGWVGVTYITAPAVGLSSYLFSTDVLLLFFIAVALWAYFGLTRQRSVGLALIMGIGVGCAFLSKYAVLFLVPGGAVALALIPSARIAWRDFFIAVLTAAVVAFPNLWWNLTHDITTVRHTQDIAHWNGLGINILGGLRFFFTQFGVVGPIVFFAMLWATYRLIRGRSETEEKVLIWLSLPVVLLITVQAIVAKAYDNWAVTAYAAGTILAVWLLHRRWPRGLAISLAINGFVCLIAPLAPILAHDLFFPDGKEALERFLGRSEVSRKAADLAQKSGTDVIVSDNRDIIADLYYTLRGQPVRIYARPPEGFPKSYYEQQFPLPAGLTGNVLLMTRKPLTCSTETPELVETWTPGHGYYRARPLYAYKVSPGCLMP
jgi:4-amino-4-deoxy-L-arabinose transferase-like glycosyltransferase